MKNLLKIFLTIIIIGCSSSNNLSNKDPHSYLIENSDGTKTELKSDTIGKLTLENYEMLKNYLTNINGYNIDFDKKFIINFIDNDPKIYRKNYQVPWDIFYGNLENDLNEIEKSNHFWIINSRVKDLHYYHGNKINWIVDKKNTVRKLFFPYEGLNGGFVIIKPNGDYFLKIGEYRKSDVLKRHIEFK